MSPSCSGIHTRCLPSENTAVCVLLPVCNSVRGVFQVSASRSDIEEAEENAMQDQRAEERTEEGLFDMVTTSTALLSDC